ncbi:MAG: V-type ATP synthase subunit F [Candidatus Micrarchaeota archaeon]
MDKIMVLGGRDMVQGFQLVGVTEAFRVEPDAAEAKLLELLQRKDAGILVIQDDFLARMSAKTKYLVETASKPVVVPIGLTSGASSENLQAMIKRAIGISLEK